MWFTYVYPHIKQKHLANFMLNVIDSLPMPYTSLIRNQDAGKESESSSFPLAEHSLVRLPLEVAPSYDNSYNVSWWSCAFAVR